MEKEQWHVQWWEILRVVRFVTEHLKSVTTYRGFFGFYGHRLASVKRSFLSHAITLAQTEIQCKSLIFKYIFFDIIYGG